MRTRHGLDQAASFTLSVATLMLAAGCSGPREAPREAATPTPAPRSTPAVQRIEATAEAVAEPAAAI